MNLRPVLLFSLMVLGMSAALVSLNDTISAQNTIASSTSEWEYKVVDARKAVERAVGTDEPDNNDLEERVKHSLQAFLNDHGRDGWELVAYSGTMAIYKRDASR